MPVLIGVDEAGYGPNYGPLCVAASAWSVRAKADGGRRKGERGGYSDCAKHVKRTAMVAPTGEGFADLYKLLRKAVARTPDKAGKKIAIADSKALYSPDAGVRQLERGVLAALAAASSVKDEASLGARGNGTLRANTRACVGRVCELLAATGADPQGRRSELACHEDDGQTLPLEAEAEEICRLAELLRTTCLRAGVVLLAVRARLVYPAEFNELVDHFGSKGAALSHVTLALVREVVDGVSTTAPGFARGALATGTDVAPMLSDPRAEPGAAGNDDRVLICLDKHGGRNRYTALLQHHFPESWIEPVSENRNRSRYRWTHSGRSMEAVFRVGCEELLPTALASMTAKYHRELAMRAFNAFWNRHLPNLRPTAGYPKDSRRFKAAIAAVQSELGIEDRLVWRNR